MSSHRPWIKFSFLMWLRGLSHPDLCPSVTTFQSSSCTLCSSRITGTSAGFYSAGVLSSGPPLPTDPCTLTLIFYLANTTSSISFQLSISSVNYIDSLCLLTQIKGNYFIYPRTSFITLTNVDFSCMFTIYFPKQKVSPITAW